MRFANLRSNGVGATQQQQQQQQREKNVDDCLQFTLHSHTRLRKFGSHFDSKPLISAELELQDNGFTVSATPSIMATLEHPLQICNRFQYPIQPIPHISQGQIRSTATEAYFPSNQIEDMDLVRSSSAACTSSAAVPKAVCSRSTGGSSADRISNISGSKWSGIGYGILI